VTTSTKNTRVEEKDKQKQKPGAEDYTEGERDIYFSRGRVLLSLATRAKNQGENVSPCPRPWRGGKE